MTKRSIDVCYRDRIDVDVAPDEDGDIEVAIVDSRRGEEFGAFFCKPEQADRVAIALIQATPISVPDVSDKIMMLPRDTRDGVYALTSEQRRALGLALIRSAR